MRPKAKALFQAGRFVGIDGDRAVFGLPNDIHRARCEEVRADVEAVLSGHFGCPVRLTLVVDDGSSTSPPPLLPEGRSGGRPIAPPTGPSIASPTAPPAGTGPPPDGPPDGTVPADGPSAAVVPTVRGGPGSSDPGPSDPGPTGDVGDDPDDEYALLDESELGEVVDVDTSAEARLLEVFPGAEEVC